MNATSRFPFAIDHCGPTISPAPRKMSNPVMRNTGSQAMSGLGFNYMDYSMPRNGSIVSNGSSGQNSPWSSTFSGNSQQTTPPASVRPSAIGTNTYGQSAAAQWSTQPENERPLSDSSSSSIRALNRQLEEKDATVSELKMQVETLMTAITLGNSAAVGSMDGAELAHRMMVRLKSLRSENERLMTLASHKHAARLEVELDALKQENAALRKQLAQ